MHAREVAGQLVQECERCLGLWAPEGTFEALVDRAAAVGRERDATGAGIAPRVAGGNPASVGVAYRRCPICDEFRARRNFRKRSGVIVDRCRAHGTWLDAHELERIAGFVLSGRSARAGRMASPPRASERGRGTRGAVPVASSSRSHPVYAASAADRSGTKSALDWLISLLD